MQMYLALHYQRIEMFIVMLCDDLERDSKTTGILFFNIIEESRDTLIFY